MSSNPTSAMEFLLPHQALIEEPPFRYIKPKTIIDETTLANTMPAIAPLGTDVLLELSEGLKESVVLVEGMEMMCCVKLRVKRVCER